MTLVAMATEIGWNSNFSSCCKLDVFHLDLYASALNSPIICFSPLIFALASTSPLVLLGEIKANWTVSGQQIFISHRSESWKSKIRVPMWFTSDKSLFVVHQGLSSCYTVLWQEGLFYTKTLHEGPTPRC